MKTGIELMADERQRHFDEEGWTPEHDDEHGAGALSLAAACYVLSSRNTFVRFNWPWDWKWWKPTTNRIRNLVKAGSLIAAEIDRLQRAKDTP